MPACGTACRFRFALLVSTAAMSAAFPAAAPAQLTAEGPELQVNTDTLDFQSQPEIAVDGFGRFVVVWTNSFEPLRLGDCCQTIQARRLDADGTPLGGQFQVSSQTTSYQLEPAVAADASGGFVVVWSSNGSNGTDADFLSIQAQRFDAAAAPVGSRFQVNSYTTSGQSSPEVAMDSSGGFVVVWNSQGSTGTDSSLSSIQARRFDADGDPSGDEFQVNSFTTGAQHLPAVARRSSGEFVVAWVSDGSPGNDDDSWSIQARRFDANGAGLGDQFQANTFTSGTQLRPAIASDTLGNFVLSWDSQGSFGGDASSESIQARLFDAGGTAFGPEIQVNSHETGAQLSPDIARGAGGSFVIVWSSDGSPGDDSDTSSIQARWFEADGAALTPQLQVNSYTTSAQRFPRVEVADSPRLLVTWESLGSSGTDTSHTSILAQFLSAALFYDGFESGDTDRWSSSQP